MRGGQSFSATSVRTSRISSKLTTGAANGMIRSNTDGTVRGGVTITRADVAAYLLGAIEDAAVIRKTLVITN
jgi:hypothetical protein